MPRTPDQLRVFSGRDSSGVRGIRLGSEDAVISLAVLAHADATPAEREAYLKAAAQKRRAAGEDVAEPVAEEAEEPAEDVTLTPNRFRALEDMEEVLLVVTDRGFGKRSSAYGYRVTGRGGQGITNMTLTPRTGREVVATFPVRMGDGVMLVTDGGRLIRLPADQVRITGRSAQGVMLLRLGPAERVSSCFPIVEEADETTLDEGPPELDPQDGEPDV